MKLLIITGSYPPQICGVGDYTYKLMQSQKSKDWVLYHSKQWNITSLFSHIRSINRMNINNINMQYPTQGYGWSLIPHLLCFYFSLFSSKKFSVTIHEQSQLSFKARIAQSLILLTANKIVFTNEFERNYAIKRYPFMRRRSRVIKIFSNIPAVKRIKDIQDRKYDIINFGHIRPNKGLEQFINDVTPFTNKYKVLIVGQVPEGFDCYFKGIEKLAADSNIEIIKDLSDEDVSILLNDSKLIYLPFPDGASERRGSLLASMLNGAVVVSTKGVYTTPSLSEAIIDIKKEALIDILSNSNLMIEKQSKSLKYIENQLPRGWDAVINEYNKFIL